MAAPTITYHVAMPQPHTHYFEVNLEIANLDANELTIKMPVWTPGSYLVREFSRKVEGVQAFSNNEPLSIDKKNKNTWHINTKGVHNVSVQYKVYSFEQSVRTSFLDADHAFINGASLFLYPDGYQNLPGTVHIKPHPDFKKISTSLKPLDSRNAWVLSYPNYDILVDSPIEIGNHEVVNFEANGIPHTFAIFGHGNHNITKMVEAVKKIVTVCTNVFGDNPCSDYLFIIHNTDGMGGGLEHLNSQSIMCARWDYGEKGISTRFMSLACHEYFHLWNVKRIRPITLGPFNYETENYTSLLWVSEGFTSYYDDYLLQRAGLINTKQYLETAAGNINTHQNTPGRMVQPVSESSLDAWIKYYRPDENTQNSGVSYYTTGAVMAMLLDLEIMHSTNGNKCLDDVMRILYNDFYKKQGRGFTDEEMKQTVETVANKKMDNFWTNHINGTANINYDQFFDYAGLHLEIANKSTELSLGVKLKQEGSKLNITNVQRGTCGFEGGLSALDELVAVDGLRTYTEKDVTTALARHKTGDKIVVTVTRYGLLRDLTVTLTTNPNVSYQIVKAKNATDQQKAVYKKWLSEDF
ncbi:MAG: M61 family metallopeptidase [Chitinophagales bacterium]|nr:M61 family metallopeptidase [Sphingobacteriales bacterium]MBP9141801.1 M61 family metallopeptidase [Chitinophagales bacterium]MDA0199025.1 PDZ domain-containing protein [Bacteroidota bacterium]MBK6889520.1 M61 family metallopeptidase [Sphingobacteriales bacterium]MBL0246297.1 M61 family metallopeptidase [Sphingobacteriales bacterium]